jgi:D-glucosaminate-6-phosphate ammonia-lyase
VDWPKPVVNAAGPLTWLGGGPLHPRVRAAMAAAAETTWDMPELQRWAGRRLAQLLGVPGVLVTAGASAAMTLAAAAVAGGDRFDRQAALPDWQAPLKLAIQRSQRTAYDRAWLLPGLQWAEFGFSGPPGTGTTQPWQLEAVLRDPTVVGVAVSVFPDVSGLPLRTVVEISHAAGRPVLVDAAACLPPLRRLQEVVESGADLVAVSGGKALGGPQNSGLLIAAESWIEAAALQNFDWDLDARRFEELFGPASGGLPVHGVGRGFKVSKETVMGLVAAVERFVTEYDQIAAGWAARLARIEEAVSGAGVAVRRVDDAWGGPVLLVNVGWPTAVAVADQLRSGSPRIEVGRHELTRGLLTISPLALRDDEVEVVADRLQAVLLRERGRDGGDDARGV